MSVLASSHGTRAVDGRDAPATSCATACVGGVGHIVVACALFVGALTACQDNQLHQLHAKVSLCPAATSATSDCDGTIELGDVPAGVSHDVAVFVLDRGDGRLDVGGASVDDGGAGDVTVKAAPEVVAAGEAAPLTLTFLVGTDRLGAHTANLTVNSNDATRAKASVQLSFRVVPPPAPAVQWCDGDGDATCGANLDVDLGSVRPTESASRTLYVKNAGDAPLAVDEIRPPAGGDISVASSTRGGVIDPGDAVAVVVLYAPGGPGDDDADVAVISDDPVNPQAVAHVHGSAGANLPPVAVAVDSVTLSSAASVKVGEQVGVVGTGSHDPEGDPLAFAWTLAAPTGSAAALDDDTAADALFVPDVAGTYSVALVVADSLAQQSAPAVVTVTAAPHFRFRARLSWNTGGDLDVHLVQSGAAPFSAGDCTFDNRDVDGGGAGSVDDATLLDDATAPGEEDAVIEAPLAGTWEVWVAYFDDAGLGTADANLAIVVDDSGTPLATLTQSLTSTCALWHAFDVDPLAGTATPVNAAIVTQCP